MTTSRPTHTEPAVPTTQTLACSTMGHAWQPTIILGYFQCRRCHTLAACVACVSKVRGNALPGYCPTHRHLWSCQTAWEILG